MLGAKKIPVDEATLRKVLLAALVDWNTAVRLMGALTGQPFQEAPKGDFTYHLLTDPDLLVDSHTVLEDLVARFQESMRSVVPSFLPLVLLGTVQFPGEEESPLLAGYFQLDWLPLAASGKEFVVQGGRSELRLEPFAYLAHEPNPYVGVALFRLRNPEALEGLGLTPVKPPSSIPAFAVSPYLGLAEVVTEGDRSGLVRGLGWAQHGWCGSPVFDALGGLYGFTFGVPVSGQVSLLPAQALREALRSLEGQGIRVDSPLR